MKNILENIFKIKKNFTGSSLKFLELNKNFEIYKIFEAISEFNKYSEIRYVGGCVRKILNNENVDDIDLATNVGPSDVINCLKKKEIKFYETGIEHGTVTAQINKKNFEITTLRKDLTTDGRHAVVQFSNDWAGDASRRDFTINAIYADKDGNLFDPFNGKKDLRDGKINFIGDIEKRIKEDYLRILRYVRFYLNYSKHEHDAEVKKIIRQNIKGLSNISNERLLSELKKLVLSKGFLKINDDQFSLEIIQLIFPQLKNIGVFKNLNQYSKENFLSQNFIFLLSLMIIDETDNAEYFQYKFNISNEDKKKINFLKNIFYKKKNQSTFSEKNLWKIFYYYGKNNLIDMINFEIYRSKKENKKILKLLKFFMLKNRPLLPVKGNDLIEKYKLKEGKDLGEILKKIENAWVENSFRISTKDIEKLVRN